MGDYENIQRNFHPADYIVFIGVLMASTGIGLYFALSRQKRSRSTEDYLLGGRAMGLLPVAISMCVSVVSANTFLGAPAEMYAYGVHFQLTVISIPIGALLTVLFFVPVFYKIRLTSMNKYLYLRFESRVIQTIGAVIVLISQVLYVGCVMYGPATALESVTGLPVWCSILISGLTGTVYTAVGGMKAVIWTDVFQSIIMLTGLLTIIILGTIRAGGLTGIWQANLDFGRLDVNMGFDVFERYTLWTGILAYTFLSLTLFATNQSTIQRYCSTSSLHSARSSLLLNIPGLMGFTTLATAAGMVAFGYYIQHGCDPLEAGFIQNSNQLMPYFVTEILTFPGLPGLFVASLFCATLSTLSSSVNSMVAVLWEDILEHRYHHLPTKVKTLLNKSIAVGLGVVCTGFAFVVWGAGGNIMQISFTLSSITSGAQVGLFIIGLLIPWANWKGASAGVLTSMMVTAYLSIGQIYYREQRQRLPSMCNISQLMTTDSPGVYSSQIPPDNLVDRTHQERHIFSISFLMFPLIGFMVSMTVGILVSLITGHQKAQDIDANLVFPCMRRFCKKEQKVAEREDGSQCLEEEQAFEKEGLVLSVIPEKETMETKIATRNQDETST